MNEAGNNNFIKAQKKIILNIVALLACIIMIILFTMTKDVSIEILILYFFPIAELLSSIRLYRMLISFEEPQEIIVEFRIRGFVCALFLLTSVIYSISEMTELLAIGLMLYASVTEYRLKSEIIVGENNIFYRNRSLERTNTYKESQNFKNCKLLNYHNSRGKRKRIIVSDSYLKYVNIES